MFETVAVGGGAPFRAEARVAPVLGLAGVGLADVERLFGARLAQHDRGIVVAGAFDPASDVRALRERVDVLTAAFPLYSSVGRFA